MDPTQPPWVPHPEIRNLRDAGGQSFRKGFLFRSAGPLRLTSDGIATFKATGIKAVFDLRSGKEVAENSMMPPLDYVEGVDYFHVPVFDESWSPEAMLIRYSHYLAGTPLSNYVDILNALPAAIAPVVKHVLNHPDAPILVHCTAGKDRTGVLVALLLSLAGVGDRAVGEEYALTQVTMGQVLVALGERVRELGVFKKLEGSGVVVSEEGVRNMLSTKPETMEALLGKIREENGTVEEWFVEKCGLSVDQVERLKEVIRSNES